MLPRTNNTNKIGKNNIWNVTIRDNNKIYNGKKEEYTTPRRPPLGLHWHWHLQLP